MKLSIVVPIFDEEETIPHLKKRLKEVLGTQRFEHEVIFVNDGGTDNSSKMIRDWVKEDHNVVLLELSRNFGHQQAITAGLKESSGDVVVILDADLQDPPEKIPDMVKKWEQGFKIVLAERIDRKEGFIRKIFFKMFYKIFVLFSDLPVFVNSGVYGLMDRVVVNQLLALEERNRYLPGLRSWVGFETATIYYKRDQRVAGKPKQSFKKLFKYGLNAIFSFSYKPLRISFIMGMVISSFFFLYGIILIILRLLNINVVRGFTTSTVAIFFIGGVLLISNGIIGEYLARIYDEVKRRPLYIVSRKISRKKNETKLNVEGE